MEIKEGYKRTDVGIIPQEWDVKCLGEIGKPIIGLTYRPDNVKESGTLVLRSCNIGDYGLQYDNNVFVDVEIPQKLTTQEDDLLICVRNGSRDLIGKCALIDSNAVGITFGAFMSIFRSNEGKYVNQCFKSNIITKQIEENIGATINQITNKNLRSFNIPYPEDPVERGVISTALSDADALITSLEKLIAKKRNIKQGAMQELLKPKEGWKMKNLYELAQIKKGEQLNRATLSDNDSYPVMNGGIQPSGYTSKWNQAANTIIISEGGNSCGFVNYMRKKFWQGGHCYSLSTKIHTDFLYHLLKHNELHIMGLRVGSGLPNIQRNRLESYTLSIPKNSVQIEIADILNEMDAEITALEQKLEKYKMIKQGMMQSLLTGQIRLI